MKPQTEIYILAVLIWPDLDSPQLSFFHLRQDFLKIHRHLNFHAISRAHSKPHPHHKIDLVLKFLVLASIPGHLGNRIQSGRIFQPTSKTNIFESAS